MGNSVTTGTKAYAALITIDWENRDVMWTVFEEEEGHPDPLLQAQALGRSVAADWPSHEQKVIGNERAGELQAVRLLGFDPFHPADPEGARRG